MRITPLKKISAITMALAMVSSFGFVSVANATAAAPADKGQIQTIINRGTSEINRRLTILSKLDSKVTASAKLSTAQQTALTNAVNAETSSLTTLKAQLASATTLAEAQADAQSIFTEYHGFSLIVPQAEIVKAADDQQVAEARLSALATKLQGKVTSSSASSIKTDLSDMTSKVSAAQSISSTIETKVAALKPADAGASHAAVNSDLTQLKTAQTDNIAAAADAKAIIATVKA